MARFLVYVGEAFSRGKWRTTIELRDTKDDRLVATYASIRAAREKAEELNATHGQAVA